MRYWVSGLVFFLCLGAMPLIMPAGSAEAGFTLPNVGKACLPERAQPSYNWSTGSALSDADMPSCHCPPKEMCPQTVQEWKDHPRMPGFLANSCCKESQLGSCQVMFQASTVSWCPDRIQTESEPITFCMQSQARSGGDAVKREKAEQHLNDCMATQCKAKIAAVQKLQTTPIYPNYPYYPEGTDISEIELPANMVLEEKTTKSNFLRDYMVSFTDVLNLIYTPILSTNNKIFLDNAKIEGHFIVANPTNAYGSYHEISSVLLKEAVSCQSQCRSEAAKEIDPTLYRSANVDKLLSYLKVDQDNILGYSLLRQREIAKAIFPQYINLQQNWAESVNARKQRLQQYLQSNPAVSILNNDGLSDHLSCIDSSTADICYAALVNNGSCATCLSPDTPILLGDGSSKAINQLAEGDVVKSAYDTVAKVKEIIIKDWPVLTLYSINNGALQLTADHPVMTTVGWRAIDYQGDTGDSGKRYGLQHVPELKVGDVLVSAEGEIVVESIEAQETKTNGKTYNLRLDGGDSFYAGGILVKSNN